jgi:hypothetical protein
MTERTKRAPVNTVWAMYRLVKSPRIAFRSWSVGFSGTLRTNAGDTTKPRAAPMYGDTEAVRTKQIVWENS